MVVALELARAWGVLVLDASNDRACVNITAEAKKTLTIRNHTIPGRVNYRVYYDIQMKRCIIFCMVFVKSRRYQKYHHTSIQFIPPHNKTYPTCISYFFLYHAALRCAALSCRALFFVVKKKNLCRIRVEFESPEDCQNGEGKANLTSHQAACRWILLLRITILALSRVHRIEVLK